MEGGCGARGTAGGAGSPRSQPRRGQVGVSKALGVESVGHREQCRGRGRPRAWADGMRGVLSGWAEAEGWRAGRKSPSRQACTRLLRLTQARFLCLLLNQQLVKVPTSQRWQAALLAAEA